ncbi:uncharacterized protein LOC128624498 [Ictalurus furcatus]|uniref:uncharacterized protein LOC128624498 n=1 Tax=Ictalurus furcatus TaxID=66913 RepID=UPI0023506122|nr:uncharacterized protein LOC128624498 [Ictalurus furcatus]XP_053508169.1 uncharacterized protein LOC128624498 [Ictalurus furcatus]
MKMKMKMKMKMMLLFLSVLLFLSHFSATFPLKGCVCEPVENAVNTTRLINTLWIIRNKPTSSVNLTCVCVCECRRVVQLNINDSVIEVKESEREVLEDECVKLVEDLSRKKESGDLSVLSVVTPLVGASIFITLLLLSFTMFKRQESQAGGVLGSLIHYPAHSLEKTTNPGTFLPPETKIPY